MIVAVYRNFALSSSSETLLYRGINLKLTVPRKARRCYKVIRLFSCIITAGFSNQYFHPFKTFVVFSVLCSWLPLSYGGLW